LEHLLTLKLTDEQSAWLLSRAREMGVTPEAAALDMLEIERRKAPTPAILDLFGTPAPAARKAASPRTASASVPVAPASLAAERPPYTPFSPYAAAAASAAAPAAAKASEATDRSSREAAWKIWSDGACSGNPGPGGWGTIVEGPDGRQELSGGWRHTTNNRMEMMGAIVGLEEVPRGERAVLTTDSRYIVDAIEKKWLAGWKRKGWRKADGGPVANVDLWQALEAAMAGKFVRIEWVRGHNGHAENERCDVLAVTASKRKDLPPDPA
jgi:ribonuclease HI